MSIASRCVALLLSSGAARPDSVQLIPLDRTDRLVLFGVSATPATYKGRKPTLIVNDLKLGDSRGRIGLWIGPGTEGWFSRPADLDDSDRALM